MKRTYENFEELAKEMTRGEGLLHAFNCVHDTDGDCLSWQDGITDFAEWLDHIGVKVEISDGQEDFYSFMKSKKENPCTLSQKKL